SQVSLVTIFISGLTLCRVICMRPNLVSGKMVCLDLSSFISAFIASYTALLLSAFFISMKSMTMIPPISRRRSCLAISFTVTKLVFKSVVSWSHYGVGLSQLCTSTTRMASVCSIMSDPPWGRLTARANRLLISYSIPILSKSLAFAWYSVTIFSFYGAMDLL